MNKLHSIIAAVMLGIAASTPAAAQPVEQPNVKLLLDWVYDGAHAFILVADSKGYFKQEGLNVQIDAGTGSGVAVQNTASGVYQFAIADFPTMVQFNGKNPDKMTTAIYMVFDQTPIAIMSLKSKPIKTPADLDGKKITGRPGQAAYLLTPLLLKRAGIQNAKIDWQNVSPQIEGSLFARGGLDGMSGFSISQAIAVAELGVKIEDIHVMSFADQGVDLYGLGFLASKSFIEQNPRTVQAFVRAVNRGLKDSLADPKGTIEILRKRAPLIKPEFELLRMNLARDLVLTPHVKEQGLSSATAIRVQRTIDTIAELDTPVKKPSVADVYTDRFLPPAADRKVAR
jgi:NitT/TauT family transport system substrate-binding protein